MNARERLEMVAYWLGDQDENLSAGLKTAFDALRLYDYAQAHPNLPEMADEWTPRQIIAAVGYNPFEEEPHEALVSGADAAVLALKAARKLIDSVAFVAKPGDKDEPLIAIDTILNARTEAHEGI